MRSSNIITLCLLWNGVFELGSLTALQTSTVSVGRNWQLTRDNALARTNLLRLHVVSKPTTEQDSDVLPEFSQSNGLQEENTSVTINSSNSTTQGEPNASAATSVTEELIAGAAKSTTTASTHETTRLAESFLTLPRHAHHEGVNRILTRTEYTIRAMHVQSKEVAITKGGDEQEDATMDDSGGAHERVFANTYVNMAEIDIVGFDYDYTLVTYRTELLDLIYDMALKRLVLDRQYPLDLLDAGFKFDPRFSIRGLAVDKETAWICHLSYTHKVAVAWEGRTKVPSARIYEEYSAKRALNPSERKKRLKPLNDLFSMAECCLIADVVQFFKDKSIPFCPRNVVTDILSTIGETHISGDFHRLVAEDPSRYLRPTPHLKQLLESLKEAGKRLIFASNSPFWYVDAGMKHAVGPDWRDSWDAVITSAGKPNFYTEQARPFREVCQQTGRSMFKKVVQLEPGAVYTEGCLKELTKLMAWKPINGNQNRRSNVLYVGDSLFADLVDAKREYGWTTAAVTPEVGYEMEMQSKTDFVLAQRTIDILLNALRVIQDELGATVRSEEDNRVLDGLERLVSQWRDRETTLLGNPFGSVFRARYQPSLFAHSLRRYCDLYMSSVSSLRNYSPQHRFYPEQAFRLLAHEIRTDHESWTLNDILGNDW